MSVVYEEVVLNLFISRECVELMAFYTERIKLHNEGLCNTYPDSGFDLGLPMDMVLVSALNNKIALGVHCAMYTRVHSVGTDNNNTDNNNTDNKNNTNKCPYASGLVRPIPQAYYLYPRSSISKTTLRMSNSLGIIDSGYRGEITAVVDNVDKDPWCSIRLNAMDRYFQICHPSLRPFRVVMVDTIEELGITTRGDGGFGSTGK